MPIPTFSAYLRALSHIGLSRSLSVSVLLPRHRTPFWMTPQRQISHPSGSEDVVMTTFILLHCLCHTLCMTEPSMLDSKYCGNDRFCWFCLARDQVTLNSSILLLALKEAFPQICGWILLASLGSVLLHLTIHSLIPSISSLKTLMANLNISEAPLPTYQTTESSDRFCSRKQTTNIHCASVHQSTAHSGRTW